MELSKNFTLKELTRSALAMRHGLDNAPDNTATNHLQLLSKYILQPVRDHYGVPFSPSSGYRSPAVNALAGSSSTSQHVKGRAVDFEVPGVSNRDLTEWIKANLEFDQLILEFHREDDPASGWIHCSYNAGHNRNQCLVYDGKNFTTF